MSTEIRKPSIVAGVLERVSASQIKTWRLCPRMWGYEKIEHRQRKQSKGAALGEACHKQVEHYALTGEDVRGDIPLTGAHILEPYRHHLPAFGGAGKIEAPFSLRSPAGPEIIGKIDLWIPSPTLPMVIDHKFSKDVLAYGADADSFATDPQAVIYGAVALIENPTAEVVEFAHHQYQTEGSQQVRRLVARPVSRKFDRSEIEDLFQKVDSTIADMAKGARAERAADLPANESACGAYGGCSFKAICPNSPMRRFFQDVVQPAAQEGEKDMGLLAQMATDKVAAPVPVQVTGMVVGECKPGLKYRHGSGRVGTFEMLAPGGKGFFSDDTGAPFAVLATDLVVPADTLTPPAQSGTHAPSTPVEDAVASPGSPATDSVKSPEDLPAPVAKRGRPKKMQIENVDSAGNPITPATFLDAKQDSVHKNPTPPKPTPPPAAEAPMKLVLVDCYPNRPIGLDATPWVYAMAGKLAASAKVADVRLAEGNNPLSFGKWKAALAQAAIQESGNLPATLLISKSDLTEPVIEALASTPGFVVVRSAR